MNTRLKVFVASFCVMLLSSCAVRFQPPPLATTNPASVEAKESIRPAAKLVLARDALTQKTRQLLAASAPGNPSFQPSEMQHMHHDTSGMGAMQHDKTGAMEMDSGDEKPGSGKFYYTCVMHPQIHRGKPGKCPICGMTLIKKEGQK
jgi:Heavy metal binding domain